MEDDLYRSLMLHYTKLKQSVKQIKSQTVLAKIYQLKMTNDLPSCFPAVSLNERQDKTRSKKDSIG